MQKIIPHLWFDTQAREAAEFYVSVFPDSKIKSMTTLPDTPSGDAELVRLNIFGHDFTFISAGPFFEINPSISFLVSCKTKEEVDLLWSKLSPGGQALMKLGQYPFSERYGWIKDEYGVSWQLMLTEEPKQTIIPKLMYVGAVSGRSEKAIDFYTSIFPNSKIGDIMRFGKGMEPEKENDIAHAEFTLEGQLFAAMDSAQPHDFNFNEAISLMVNCDTQEEIDFYWEKLSADPEAEQCGWLKDKYGLSWQIVPTIMEEMLTNADPEKTQRVTEAFLQMKKFDIATLKQVYQGEMGTS